MIASSRLWKRVSCFRMATTKNTLVQTVAIFFRPIVHSFTLYALCVCSLWIYFRINAPQPIIRTIDYSECSALNGEMWKEKHYEKNRFLMHFYPISLLILLLGSWIRYIYSVTAVMLRMSFGFLSTYTIYIRRESKVPFQSRSE